MYIPNPNFYLPVLTQVILNLTRPTWGPLDEAQTLCIATKGVCNLGDPAPNLMPTFLSAALEAVQPNGILAVAGAGNATVYHGGREIMCQNQGPASPGKVICIFLVDEQAQGVSMAAIIGGLAALGRHGCLACGTTPLTDVGGSGEMMVTEMVNSRCATQKLCIDVSKKQPAPVDDERAEPTKVQLGGLEPTKVVAGQALAARHEEPWSEPHPKPEHPSIWEDCPHRAKRDDPPWSEKPQYHGPWTWGFCRGWKGCPTPGTLPYATRRPPINWC